MGVYITQNFYFGVKKICFPVNPRRLLKILLHDKLPSEVIYIKPDLLVVLKQYKNIKLHMLLDRRLVCKIQRSLLTYEMNSSNFNHQQY